MATAPSPPPPSAEKKNENEVITTITGKQYVTPDGLLKMSYRLARMIVDSGFKPQFTGFYFRTFFLLLILLSGHLERWYTYWYCYSGLTTLQAVLFDNL